MIMVILLVLMMVIIIIRIIMIILIKISKIILNNLAHIHEVEDVDRDAKESINHCRNLSPFGPENFT